MFLDWYKKFASNWNYSNFDILYFEEKENILESLISLNNEWEQNIDKMEAFFRKDKKRLDAKIKKLKKMEE